MELDEMVDDAWRDFRATLADAIDELRDSDLVVPLADDDTEGPTVPHVEVIRAGDTLTLAVPGNRLLDEQHRLDERGKRQLRRLGFRMRRDEGTDHRFATYDVGQLEEVAAVAVTVLRDLFGVLHPTFLDQTDLAVLLGRSLESVAGPPAPVEDPSPMEGVGATYATDLDHLDLLIEEVVIELVGGDFSRDEDGDIPLISGTAVVYVHRAADMPLVRLFSVMVVEISDRAAADAEVARLNREVDGVKFERRDDQILASMDLVAQPFAPEHLVMLANHMCRVVSERDGGVAAATGGKVFLNQLDEISPSSNDVVVDDPGPASGDVPQEAPTDPVAAQWQHVRHGPGAQVEWEGVHPVMRTIQQIESEKPGSLQPKTAARLCSNDPALVGALLRWSEADAQTWKFRRDAAARDGDDEEAEACEHLRKHAARTVRVLRKALRLLSA